MKDSAYILFVVALIIGTACKKTHIDEQASTTSDPVVVPFVEYRSSFTGTYQGVYSKINSRTSAGGLPMPDDTLDFNTNALNQISLLPGNDSALRSTLPGRTFNINGNGKWLWQSRKCAGCPDSLYRVTFRADSLYLDIIYNTGTHPHTSYYFTSFKGKKQ